VPTHTAAYGTTRTHLQLHCATHRRSRVCACAPQYIKFGQLKPRTTYYYKVKSGSDACGYSAVYSFRSGYTTGVTRLATYGDMGHSHYNNVDNMLQDCKAGTIDAIVHLVSALTSPPTAPTLGLAWPDLFWLRLALLGLT
jgi:hypothetical protein